MSSPSGSPRDLPDPEEGRVREEVHEDVNDPSLREEIDQHDVTIDMAERDKSSSDLELGEFTLSPPHRTIETHHIPVEVAWKDLTVHVEVKQGKEVTKRTVLSNVTGRVRPGQVLAILGPSGAGKTTFLNVLADRSSLDCSGEILVNGRPRDKMFKRVSAYVMQDDVFLGNLTVRETLLYAARLRLGSQLSNSEKERRVDDLLDELGLSPVANSIVGTPGLVRGISGGERKRLSIAQELITDPSVLCLDEPTSGLDAHTALSVMDTIIRIAREGNRTVLCTIHQPRSNIFKLFDQLLILARGKIAYFGTADHAVEYFGELGYQIEESYNPADYFMDLVTEFQYEAEHRRDRSRKHENRVKLILDAWDDRLTYFSQPPSENQMSPNRSSSMKILDPGSPLLRSGSAFDGFGSGVLEEQKAGSTELSFGPDLGRQTKFRNSWWTQFVVLLDRSFKNVIRNRMLTVARFFQTLLMGLVGGFLYLRMGDSQRAIQDRSGLLFFICINLSFGSLMGVVASFPLEKSLYVRERAAGSYYTSAYFFAKSFSELPLNLLFPSFFGTVVYWMSGLQMDAAKFFIYICILLLVANAAQSLGLFISAICPSVPMTNAIAPLIMVVFILFGGFYANTETIPVFISWIQYLSFMRWAYQALVINEFSGLSFSCAPGESGCVTNGSTIIRRLGFEGGSIAASAGILIGMFVGFRIIGYLSLRYLNKPRKVGA